MLKMLMRSIKCISLLLHIFFPVYIYIRHAIMLSYFKRYSPVDNQFNHNALYLYFTYIHISRLAWWLTEAIMQFKNSFFFQFFNFILVVSRAYDSFSSSLLSLLFIYLPFLFLHHFHSYLIHSVTSIYGGFNVNFIFITFWIYWSGYAMLIKAVYCVWDFYLKVFYWISWIF